MATIFQIDGFEHGRTTTGSNGVYDTATLGAVVTTPVRTGLRALQLSPSAASAVRGYAVAAGNRVVTQSVYIRFATLPTADVQLMHFLSTVNCYLWFMNTNDKFAVSVTTSGQVEGGPTVVANTWYRVTIECDTTTNTFQVRAIVDGGTEFVDTAASTAADITSVRLGNSTNQTYEAFYDDWVMSATAGDYTEISGWTSHQIESLIPNSDGTHNITTSGDMDSFTSTAFSNSTTNGNTFIGHRPLQAANTAEQVIRHDVGTTAEYMEFGLENLADNTKAVASVRSYATHVESASGGASLGEALLLLSDNTEVLTTGSISVIDSTEDPGLTTTIRKRMTIAPSGGWDGTKVDGLKARVGFSDAAPDVNFIDFMVEVAQYVAGAAAFERAATVDATADIVAVPQRDLLRSVSIDPTAVIDSAPQRDLLRQASVDAIADIVSAGEVSTPAVERAASLDATADVVVAGLHISERVASVDATANVVSVGQRDLLRQVMVDALADIIASGVVEGVTTFERAASLDGIADIASVSQRALLRQTSLDATADISAVPQRELMRQVVLAAIADIIAAGQTGAVGGPVPYAEAVGLFSEALARDTTTVGMAG